MKSKKASVFTLGCRLNQYETEILVDQLTAKGFEIVPWSEAVSAKNGGNAKTAKSLGNGDNLVADSKNYQKVDLNSGDKIVAVPASENPAPAKTVPAIALGIINTCAVTGLAEAKCRQIIRNFIKANPRAFCVVAGCYSQTNAEAVAKIAGVDLVVGNDQKLNLLDFVPADLAKNSVPVIHVGAISKQNFAVPFVPATTNFTQRANLKIQDGCNFMCSYCLIPKARGRARSRDFDDLLAEARSLVARGVRELILTGVNIGTYNFGGKTIVEIVDELAKIPHLARIRIGSIEPMTIPDAILDRMADENHPLMPFLHVPIQSVCDRVLRDMHRHYNVAEFLDFLRRAVQRVPALTVGTDIMVGFPGETNEEFAQTCDNFMQNPFAFCHVFTYSERAGTPAARRTDQVDVPVRQRRSVALRALSSKKRREFMKQFVGKIVEVLFENPVPAKQITPAYTRNYLRVFVAGTHKANTLARVKLLKIDGDVFVGEIVPVGIFGAGISGNAVREFLQNVAGMPSEIFDAKTQTFDEKIAANFERIVFSPAFPPNHEWLKIARERGLECLTELDFAAENLAGTRLEIPLICVTGTNGKTTLTEFLAFALNKIGVPAKAVGNNGIVFTKIVEEICCGNGKIATRDETTRKEAKFLTSLGENLPKTKIKNGEDTIFASLRANSVPANSVPATIVCETSSFQAEVLQKLVPAAVLWTNVDEDHIDRHGSLENYFRAKFHLVERLANGGICVIGESVAEKAREFKIAFPPQTKIATRAELLAENGVPAGTIFETFPQMENFAIARKFWRERGLPLEELFAAAREFKPRDHRLAKVKTLEIAGTQIEFWNDSKGTNFHAVYAALRSFAGTPILWIGGGLGKGGDIAHFARTLAGTVVEAFLIGETAAEIDENFRAENKKSTIFSSLQNAVEAARERAFELAGTFAGTQNPRVVVLFSPGFASFDMFKSYADRGRQFVKIVENL